MSSPLNCLVTGASGYVGGRLVPELLGAGYAVRCLARDPGKLGDRPWSDDVKIAEGDATDPVAVRQALEDIDVAYYLIHSLGSDGSFEERDRAAARVFADAAAAAGVRRIVYLGGIISGRAQDLSPHLRSRAEVGDILLASGVPTAVLQAAVIIGSGSASFEMLRYLTERLPVMVTPKWVHNRIQPIAVRDVLRYLVGCASLPPGVNRRFDIGGPDILSYVAMMRRYAQVAGLPPRVILPVPVLTPALSSLWVGFVTPVPAGLARPLVESLRNEVVCSEHDIAEYVPDPPGGLIPLDKAISLALRHVREGQVATRWSSAATAGAPSDPLPSDPDWAGGSLYLDQRTRIVGSVAGGGVAADRGHRRRDRLVFLPGRLGGARPARPAGGRRRAAPRPARRPAAAGRRCAGLLAGRGDRARFAAPAARRDEAARPGLARTVGSAVIRPAGPCTASGRYSGRAGSPGTPTGGRCGRSTASCSAGCSATSPPRPSGRRWCRSADRIPASGSTRMTSRVRGPCTPSTRSSSMSLVADGPLIQVSGRSGDKMASASPTRVTTWRADTMHRW